MTFSAGDRIRYECTDDDGLPLVRYGFIGGVAASDGPVVVMLDGELGGWSRCGTRRPTPPASMSIRCTPSAMASAMRRAAGAWPS